MVTKRIPNLPVFTLKTPNLDSGSNVKARATTSPISNKKTISSSQHKTIFLHDWWLVKPQCKGLAVEGVASMGRLGERVISSSPIAKRHETNVLETQDGITFIITGFINKSRTNENGFSFEVCNRFLLGFPHDWEEYISYGISKQQNGNARLDDSCTCPLKNDGEFGDLLTNKGDLNCSWLLNKLFNDSVGTSPRNVSEQSESSYNREHDIRMNIKKCQGTEDTILGTFYVKDDQMHNVENGGSDVIPASQGENFDPGLQSGMNVNSLESSEGLPGKGTDETPDCFEKKKNNPTSSVHMQKKSEDVTKFYCGRITRSISKMSDPVRRSPFPSNSNVPDDQIHSIENGSSDVILEDQGENPTPGLQSGMKLNSLKSSEGLSGKGTDKTPDSLEKKEDNPTSSARKQKKSKDITEFCRGRITRSISKMSDPVRRSPISSNSNVQDDQKHSVENGVSDVILEVQGENPNYGLQSGMNMNSFKSRSEGLPGKRTNGNTNSSEKRRKYHRSSVHKQKKSEDFASFSLEDVSFSFRRITRSISNLK